MSDKIMKERLVKYLETGDEFLFDEKVLSELKYFIIYTTRKYINEFYTKEDLIEICLYNIGLNLKKYDSSKSEITTFLTLLCERAVGEDIRYKTTSKRIPEHSLVSMNDTYSLFNDGEVEIVNTYEDVFAISEDHDYTNIVYEEYVIKACYNIENSKYRKIDYKNLKELFILYYQGYSQYYIGKTLDITQVQVSRILNKIRKETQRLLKEDNII